MPLYEYQCEACGHRFERIVKFSDPPIETCPSCGGRVHKQVSSPACQFKGTGWYITDYAKKDSGSGDKDKDHDKGKDKGDAKTDAKSESKDSAAKDTSSSKGESSTPSSDSTSTAKPAAKSSD
jgi:putative FmdB family regulatory protein